ncbi:MAG: alpha/beta hydrolase, partial [Acidimicrobiales bacterium]
YGAVPVPLDPRLWALVRLARLRPDDLSVPMAERRERAARLSRLGAGLLIATEPRPAAIGHVSVPVAGGRIRVRLYRPHGTGPFPLYVFIHGGGFCQGTLDERDQRCRAVSAGARCVVASVDYRLAPENQYPTAPEDCYAALEWLVRHADRLEVDPRRVAIGGESAGANLAAVVCLMGRDRGGPPLVHQWLDVPTTDATCSQSGFRDVPDGYLLDRAVIDDFFAHYLPSPERALEPYCSPLLAADLSGLPPAWIMTAELDKLRGDGEAYAAALRAAGVAVTHVRLAGHIHPSFAFTRLLPSARAYQVRAIAALAAAFAAAEPRG